MNKSSLIKTLQYFLVFLAVSVSTAVYSEEASGNVADTWIMVPNDGQTAKFEAAFKKHIKFRQKHKDPRSWKTYTPTIGNDLGFYVIRYCCLTWPDLDSYQAWSKKAKVNEHWNKTVAPFVKRYEHYFDELDFANSNWPENNDGMQYFAVNDYRVKMGKSGSVAQGKKSLSDIAKAMKWPYYWSWGEQIGGKNMISLVVPYNNFAAMAPPEMSFYQAVAKHLNDDDKTEALFKQWSNNFKSTNYTVYRQRADLSMK